MLSDCHHTIGNPDGARERESQYFNDLIRGETEPGDRIFDQAANNGDRIAYLGIRPVDLIMKKTISGSIKKKKLSSSFSVSGLSPFSRYSKLFGSFCKTGPHPIVKSNGYLSLSPFNAGH